MAQTFSLSSSCWGLLRRRSSPRACLQLLGTTLALTLILSFFRFYDNSGKYLLFFTDPSKPSIALVIAHTKADSISWTGSLRSQISNLRLIPYVADDPKARYHPIENKGNEAMIYVTYIIDFYSSLPDISIMIHADDMSWHVDRAFHGSMAYVISHLDLEEVKRRGYLSLRTLLPSVQALNVSENTADEGPYMATAFRETFPGENEGLVPELLGGPCCSQFAVSKEVILQRTKDEYLEMREWLLDSDLEGFILGRLWEHMWPWLFLRRATDLPVDWKALCAGWKICFADQKEFNDWMKMGNKLDMQRGMRDTGSGGGKGQRLGTHEWGILNDEILELETAMEKERNKAVEWGKVEVFVEDARDSLYVVNDSMEAKAI